MPLLYETGYMPTEKYATCAELYHHAQNIGHKYGLYERTLFQTEVNRLIWDESTSTWAVHTDRDDLIRARFVISASGPMHKPKLPGVTGLKSFKGHSFHSSRWDYNYTGGDNKGNLDKLSNKIVGIIGTGATAVQIVPRLGEWAKELYVFQRTPSSIDVRNNRPTDPQWVKTLGENWQQKRMENFNIIVSGGHQDEDLVSDGWTDVYSKYALQPIDPSKDYFVEADEIRQAADFEKMERIRARVNSIVKSSTTAEKLKPFYNQFCKRPCFHDEYLHAFNRPNVTLIDTDGQGVQAVTENGVVANGKEYKVDCLIYATGFELVTDFTQRSGYSLTGLNGLSLSDKWRDGPSTLHGWTTCGFPNHFFIQVIQSGQTPNILHGTGELANHFAYIVSESKNRGIRALQPKQAAEDSWVNTVIETNKFKTAYYKECTPGYLNNEGKMELKAAKSAPYGGGSLKYFELLRRWREKGDLEGLDIQM
jgi:cation diffusion facilitator CzcD-associated flavoprotein CzcO